MKKLNSNECFRRLLLMPFLLISVMTIIVILVLGLSILELYTVGFEQQKKRLEDTVQSRARMIEVLAEHERGHETHHETPEDYALYQKDILAKVISAHERFVGFGDTGEFVLGKVHEGKIHFLLRHRHASVDTMKPVAMDDKIAEPMRRALNAKTGTLVGLDYRGEEVLAAHEPIANLGWGIVAKIDLAEIQSPYINAIGFAIFGALVLIAAGSIIFLHIIKPLVVNIENERQYNRMLFEESPLGLALCTMDGKLVDINPAYANLIGYTEEETKKLSYYEVTPKKYMKHEEEQLKALEETGRYGPYEKEYIHKDGHLIQVRLSGRIVKRDKESYIWSSVEDISEQKRKDEALREASLVFEHTHEGIMITDPYENIVRINSTFSKMTGYSYEDVVGKTPRLLKTDKHDKAFYSAMWKSIKEEGSWYGEIWNKRKNGMLFPSLQSINAVKDENGVITAYVSVLSDISALKAYEEKLENLANHDALTSLPNRMYFNNTLEQAIYIAKRKGCLLAVLFLDLNDFKSVNDKYGHDIGDAFLQVIAMRLKKCIREEDVVARLGGDEFVIILNGLKRAAMATSVSQKIIDALAEPLRIQGHAFRPSVSIGISIYPDHGETNDELLRTADKAMYVSKSRGNDHYTLFNADG